VKLRHLEDSFDNDEAEKRLNLSISPVVHTVDYVRKSMYDFDLDTPEGIAKLMTLLPIMDPEILTDIMAEIWPQYPSDIDARRHRAEIRGFCLDWIQSQGAVDDEEQEGSSTDLAAAAEEAQADGSTLPGTAKPSENPERQGSTDQAPVDAGTTA
jgi:hypothetical protein